MPTALNIAKNLKMDEFYTQMSDIDNELQHYKSFLEGKSVYCCCDHPHYSNFYKYLCNHLCDWNIKEVVCTCKSYDGNKALCAKRANGESDAIIYCLKGDGSFESTECMDILSQSDVVITNPPFSKTQAFIKHLIKSDKKFLIVCNRNTIITKAIFPFFMSGQIRLGFGFNNRTANFTIPPMLYGHYSKDVVRREENIVRFRNVIWVTNFDVNVPQIKRNFQSYYCEENYPKYDQYDAINVNRISDIPNDYFGVMGVPITFLEGFDNEEFELLGLDRLMPLNLTKRRFTIKGKEIYARILVKRKEKIYA